MPKPSRNEIYEAVIRRMVEKSLEEQEQNFLGDHGTDTDAQLLSYICEQAQILHHAPRYREIIGWKCICERFGSWDSALAAAGLQPVSNCPVSKLPRIQAEVEKQKEVYRQKKAEKKLRSRKRMQEQQKKQKEHKKS